MPSGDDRVEFKVVTGFGAPARILYTVGADNRLTLTATIGANGRFTIGGAASGLILLKFDTVTGLIQETARVDNGVAIPLNGVMLPSQRQGRGILWLSDRTGWLTLDPPSLNLIPFRPRLF